jgi:hypothetical protein
MALTSPAKRVPHQRGRSAVGPELAFSGSMAAALAALGASTIMLPRDLVFPILSTVFFMLAGVVALVAAISGRSSERDPPTYWDIAGALTFIGICVAALIDPDQLVRIVQRAHRDN